MINGRPFPISWSLHTLLFAKRKSRHHVLFWIDAICINQSDIKEKSEQVGLMRRIFEEASCTIGWLGDSPGAEKALGLVQRINQTPDHLPFQTLQPDSDSGWKELSELLANNWFQRVWIIQEIAVAKSPLIRYGKQELEWKELVNALSLIIAHGLTAGIPEDILHSRYIVNALVIENIRMCIERVDYLHLEDVLKLGAIFQATLPVDKVFALLGIAEERNRSLLSLDYSAKVPDLAVWHAKNLFHDLYRTADTINDIKGTISGLRNSRRSQTIRSSPNGVKYLKSLLNDSDRILQNLRWLARKRKTISPDRPKEYDVLRPEYSKQTTPESVYSLVAKVSVGKGNFRSIIRHAGIGLSRNKDFKNLPSWVPDWSSPLDSFVLPSRIPRTPGESQTQDLANVKGNTTIDKGEKRTPPAEVDAQGVSNGEPISYESIRDASFGFHSDVAGNSTGSCADIIEAARLDFHSQISNYTKALSLAQQFCRDRDKTKEAIENAFFRTILADVGSDGFTPASERNVASGESWVYGVRDDCRVAMALREPEDIPAYWTQVLGTHDSSTIQSNREQICAKYLFLRRMQSSANTRFVHMARTVVLPSFDKYRLRDDNAKDAEVSPTMDSKFRDRHLSFFDDDNAGPLAAYGEYVDYTLDRRLAITDFGHMGWVPLGAQLDDVFIQSSSEKQCLLLRRLEPRGSRDIDGPRREESSRPRELFRLVGEAYIHEVNNSEDKTKKSEVPFKIW